MLCRIRVPPLREHASDIALLSGHFSDRTRRRLGAGPIRFQPGAMAALVAGEWPGNVRELENVISRAALRAHGRTVAGEPVIVQLEDLGDVQPVAARAQPVAAPAALAGGRTLRDAVHDFERATIRVELERAQGNRAAAARALGMHRGNLHHLAKRLGLT